LPRVKRAPSPDAEVLNRFRVEVMQLYKKFEEDLVIVSRKYGFEINMWYSPSKIPQPNFRAGSLLLDVDQLYHDQNFQELISQHYPLWNSHMNAKNERGGGVSPTGADVATGDLLKKNIELRQERLDLSYKLGLLDFKQGSGDLRLKRSRPRREDSL